MTFRFDGYLLDPATRTLTGPDGAVHVEPQVFDVLAYLLEHRDRVVEKVEILDTVWGDRFVSESALTSRIKAARRAIGDDGTAQRLIATLHGRGYRFVGDVTDGAADPVVPAEGRRPTPGLAAAIGVDDDFPFVGREHEVAEIVAAVASHDGARIDLVTGPAGIGKSRMAVEVAERCRADLGAVIGAGRCDETLTVSLQPWRDVLTHLAGEHPSRFREWGEGVAGVLVSLVPSLSKVLDVPTVTVTPDDYAAADAVATVVAAAAGTEPVVVVIDDLQWSDAPTRSLIALLTRRYHRSSVRIIATVRSGLGEAAPEVDGWLAEMVRAPGTHRHVLPALDRGAVSELAHAVLGDGDAPAPDVWSHTEGYALMVTETLRDLQHGGATAALPETVAGLVAARLGRLPVGVRDLVTAGAALGPDFDIATAAAVVEMSDDEAAGAADLAIRADLVHETGDAARLRFSHQLVPAAVLADLTGPARRRLHQRCATALARRGAPPTAIAFHRVESIPLVAIDDAVADARAAALHAMADFQFDRAIRLLERVLRLDVGDRVRAETLVVVGEAHNEGGRVPAGRTFFIEAFELARSHGWWDLAAASALGHEGASPYRDLRGRRTTAMIDEVLEHGSDLDARVRSRLRAKAAAFHLFDWRLDERDRHSAEALTSVDDLGPADELALLESRWIAIGCPLRCEEVAVIDARLDVLRDEVGRVGRDAAAPECVHLWRGDGDAFRAEAFGFMVDADRRRGMDYWRSFGLRGAVAAFEGRIDEARRLFDEAADIGAEHWGDSAFVLHTLSLQLCDVLEDVVAGRALDAIDGLYAIDPTAILGTCLAWEQARAGRREDAEETLAGMRPSSLEWFGEHILGGSGLVAAGEVAILLDDAEWAVAAERALESVGELVLGLPWSPSLAAADVLARLAARRGDDAAVRRWRGTADSAYRRLDAPAYSARLERLLG